MQEEENPRLKSGPPPEDPDLRNNDDLVHVERDNDDSGSGGTFVFNLLGLLTLVLATSLGLLLQWRAEERRSATSGGLARPPWMGPYVMATRSGRKYKDVGAEIHASLENMWRSEAVAVRYRRQVPCPHCGGAGGRREHCHTCGGRGIKTMVNRAMGVIHQVECPACHGQGYTLSSACHKCGGSGRHDEEGSEWAHLSPGLQGGDVIRVVGRGEAHPNLPSGDLAISIHEDWSDFPHLSRCNPSIPACGEGEMEGGVIRGSVRSVDLYTEVSISLAEALNGFRREISHPSGVDVVLDTTATTTSSSSSSGGASSFFEEKAAEGSTTQQHHHQREEAMGTLGLVASGVAKDLLPRSVFSFFFPSDRSSALFLSAQRGERPVVQPGSVLVFPGKGLPRRTSWFDARTLHAQQGEAIAELQEPEEWSNVVGQLAHWLRSNGNGGNRGKSGGIKKTSAALFAAMSKGAGGGSPVLPLLGIGDVPLPPQVCRIPVISTVVGCTGMGTGTGMGITDDGDGSGRGIDYGDLVVKVNAVFPDSLSREQKKALGNLLP